MSNYEIMNKDCIVHYTKRKKVVINEKLLDEMNAWNNLELIKKLHIEKYKVFIRMNKSTKPFTLQKLAKEVTAIEFKLQDAWGFPQNENMHRWFDIPKCLCPKMDNANLLKTEYKIYDKNCPIHGNLLKK